MSGKDVKEGRAKKEMTAKRAVFGFFAPILVLIILMALGAEVTIAGLAALFVMIIYRGYMD